MNDYQEQEQNCNLPQRHAISQVVELCERSLRMKITMAGGGSGFYSVENPERAGIVQLIGTITEDFFLLLRVELLRTSGNITVNPVPFFRHLANLSERVHLVPPYPDEKKTASLFVELRISNAPLSFSRSTALSNELIALDELAKTLQAELPHELDSREVQKLYSPFADVLEPVHPLIDAKLDTAAVEWANRSVDFLSGGSSLAISCPYPIEENAVLSLLSAALTRFGSTLARILPPAISPKTLLDIAKRAPGIVAVPAARLSLGTNPYELANEVQATLAALTSSRAGVVFSGTEDQLRFLFHGGQGGIVDPLSPVVRHAPSISIELLALSALRSAYRQNGGLTQACEEELLQEILKVSQKFSHADQKRILPSLANRSVYLWKKGKMEGSDQRFSFASIVSSVSETFAGIAIKPRGARLSPVQQRYIQTFTDPELGEFLKQELLGQDAAIDQLICRLRAEALTRPQHQPLRYCAQGTPATGKSESAALLASRLGIPYVNVDAASIPDYYSAAAQLLGSGRGIVGSYQSGRLEQAAKQPTGVLIEVSDLDHANERVRSGLADLFLQVLETGEAQSAAGAMFSCANIIFAFTMNLPDRMDESVRKGFGFNNAVTDLQVQNSVMDEIKKILSTAFLSRIGTPILFQPLGADAMALILEKAVGAAIQAACKRLNHEIAKITFEKNFGASIAATMQNRITSFGARALLEKGRSLAAEAVAGFTQQQVPSGQDVHVSFQNGKLLMETTGGAQQVVNQEESW